ncbi:Uma2 family endonuclease [filamentous cyanobacterium LEGE 11480]|uniref:Uma2 family endonuclease n=1 Tax=Romeriopsis navalis LEGE 11480 TaxID=2777977 RepID=A0A928VVD0_9CYAN|nr:Uma2 family endonuclease [Romeriopsis navalis]MBE9032739.1 Uma2 family endonuclease [Romeriopsis navalis LEGE 11480]
MTILNKSPNLNFTPEPTALKRWTVEDYHRISELGMIRDDERTELIAGQVLFMAAKETPHILALRLLSIALDKLLADQSLFISTQDPIQLDDFSEPEPDCAIVRGTALNYADRHPCPSDIALVVEVADSTLKYDTEVKDKLYAQSGIVDYWVVDLKNRQLHIFRNPMPTGYTKHLILTEPNQVTPLSFSNIILNLTDILPPAM